MPINASNTGGGQKELIPPGNYPARCIRMIHLGTIEEMVMGKPKQLNKVRLTWELPGELKVFKEENGPQPLIIDKEFTLSLHEKANLRLALKSWRGKDFTEEQAAKFDITALLGVACMLNIIHKPGKADPSKTYQEIAGITGVPKGFNVPEQINPTFELDYEEGWSEDKFNSLPDFIKTKMMGSVEYKKLKHPATTEVNEPEESPAASQEPEDDLPF